MDSYKPTKRTRLRRRPQRAHYDRATVHAVLDAGVLCHIGYVVDGQPFVTPTAYWRHGDHLYWHGSAASGMLRQLVQGVKVCVTVSHLDGLVLARSAFHHSINYRSLMAFGVAEKVTGAAEKRQAMEDFLERLFPGRSAEVRAPTDQELKQISVLRMAIDEVSVKIRSGPPIDDAPDYALPCWAGEQPLAVMAGAPVRDPQLPSTIALPAYLRAYTLAR
jgi:uncharacterized protein